MSALSNSGGFWYHVYQGEFTADKCIECFKQLLKHRKKPMILIVGGYPVYKSKKVIGCMESLDGFLGMIFLPPHAPDLNPDELVWNHMRNIVTSKKPPKEGWSLMNWAIRDLESIKSGKNQVKSFFQEDNISFTAV